MRLLNFQKLEKCLNRAHCAKWRNLPKGQLLVKSRRGFQICDVKYFNCNTF